MKSQTIFNVIMTLALILLGVTTFKLNQQVKNFEQVIKDGGVYAKFVKTRQVAIVNPNGLEVIKLESDPVDTSGYGDGLILVNEGQGLKNQADKLKASVQIRANAKLGGMVAAQSHRIYKSTSDGRIRLEVIPQTPVKADKQP